MMYSQHYNSFCKYCVGRDCKEIRKCNDTNCPFFPFRYGGLEKEEESKLCKQIMKNTGMIE